MRVNDIYLIAPAEFKGIKVIISRITYVMLIIGKCNKKVVNTNVALGKEFMD